LKPVLAVVEALAVSAGVLLVLLVGFCTLFVLPKLRRRRGGDTYFSADAPSGPVDQLRTPELLETKARKSA
jgi:hypothetical protein